MRRTRCARILRRIESVAATARGNRCRRARRHRRVLRAGRARRTLPGPFLKTVFGVLLHTADLTLELLIAELQLLDHPGELPDLGFESVEAHDQLGARSLCRPLLAGGGRRARPPAPPPPTSASAQ